jgi:hypothetical protein
MKFRVMCLLLAFSHAASATEYFVNQASPEARNTNPGTEAEPWATIQHAADSVAPGDTVTVAPGTYPERVVVTRGGADGSMITLRAVPSRSVHMFGFNVTGAPHVRIEGFDITSSPDFAGWDETQGVFVQSDHVEIVDNYFHDMADAGIVGYWHEPFANYVTVTGNRLYTMQMGISIQGTGWVVTSNEVERLYHFADGDCDYSRVFGDGHVIAHNFFHGTQFSEIADAHVDCFQTFDNNGEHLRDTLIDGNTCYDFHQAFMGEASFYRASGHIVFTNNVFAHGGAWGICVHQITDVEVYNNTFYDIAYHGAGFRDGATGIVKNNIFMQVATSYWASDGGEVSGDDNLIMSAGAPDLAGPGDQLDVDPMFVDAAGDDFHLQAASPAVDRGEALPIVVTDHDGTARPQGAGYDVGAYELCEAGCTTPDAGPIPPPLDATYVVPPPSESSSEDGGCGCSAAGGSGGWSIGPAVLAALALGCRRRRARWRCAARRRRGHSRWARPPGRGIFRAPRIAPVVADCYHGRR